MLISYRPTGDHFHVTHMFVCFLTDNYFHFLGAISKGLKPTFLLLHWWNTEYILKILIGSNCSLLFWCSVPEIKCRRGKKAFLLHGISPESINLFLPWVSPNTECNVLKKKLKHRNSNQIDIALHQTNSGHRSKCCLSSDSCMLFL